MNPVELGQGTFPLSEAATDRFAIMINIGYLPPEEEQKLVNFDFKEVRLNKLMSKERIIQLRSRITEQVFLHERLGNYIQQLVAATRPYNPDTDWLTRFAVRARRARRRSRRVTARDHLLGTACQGLGAPSAQSHRGVPGRHPGTRPYVLSHRVWLGPHAASHGLTSEAVIQDILERVPIP